MSKYTAEDIAKLKAAREANPEFAAWIDEFRKEFPGSKLTYIKVGDIEFGTPSKPGVTPCLLDVPAPVKVTTVTIPEVNTKGLSVYEKAVIEKQRILKGKKR